MVKFSLGQVVATQGVMAEIPPEEIFDALARHQLCDWGVLCIEDKNRNDEAVLNGGRLLSSYRTQTEQKFWIITEWDRSVTTVLLPDEY